MNTECTNEAGMTINLETLKTDVLTLNALKNTNSNNENWLYDEFIVNKKRILKVDLLSKKNITNY